MIDGVDDVGLVKQEEKGLWLWLLQSSVETANNGGKSRRADLWSQGVKHVAQEPQQAH